MNTLQSPQLPRQFATGSAIALLHVLLFGFIILNPVKHFQSSPKETIVMMVPSIMPKPIAPANITKATLKTATPAPQITPTVQQVAVQQVTQNAITAAPTSAEINLPAPTTPTVNATTIAKAEPTGPKVISAVEYIQAPQADYPPMARRMGEEGRVVMQVLVNDKGRAEKVEILKSSGFARLDESAKLALLRALFKPYVEDGKATMVLATASINFSLRG